MMEKHDWMRARVFEAIGVSAIAISSSACGSVADTGPSSSSGKAEGAEESSSGDESTSTETSDSSVSDSGSTTTNEGPPDPVRLDIGSAGPPDHPDPGPEPESCPPLVPEGQYATPPAECPEGQVVCFEAPQAECDAIEEGCILWGYECGLSQWGHEITCGPFVTDVGECCYAVEGSCAVGRPYLVDGAPRLAETRPGSSWIAECPLPDVTNLTAASRAALADVWRLEAVREHASVASFSRFILQLLSIGAPADLIERSHRALREEMDHAKIAFTLASTYAAAPVEPGPLDVSGGLEELTPRAIACSLTAEGCIAETVAAALIATAAERATDPAVRQTLAQIAAEELEHAALAWRALAWVLSTADLALIDAVQSTFDDDAHHVGLGPSTHLEHDPTEMRAHGYLSILERKAIARSTLEQVIRPAARALLRGHAATTSTDRRERQPSVGTSVTC